jgi:hypothetical protein
VAEPALDGVAGHWAERGVRRHPFVAKPPEQLVDRAALGLAEQVPDREVDAGERHDREALAPEVVGGPVHLLPDRLDVARVLADDHIPQD